MNETLREKQERENRERAEALRLRRNEREQERTEESLRDRVQRDRANRIEERRALREGREPELIPPPKSPLEVMADFIQKILDEKAQPRPAAPVEEPAVIQKRDAGFQPAAPVKPQRPNNQRDQVFDGSAYAHPFMLFQNADKNLMVEYGNVDVMAIKPDSAGLQYATFYSLGYFTVGVGTTNGGPDKVTGGEIALAASTTYGVWLSLEWQGNAHDPPGSTAISFQFVDFWLAGYAGGEIIISTAYTDPGDYYLLQAANASTSYFYIGKIITDADKVGDIRQYRKSDIVVPSVTLPRQILSQTASVNDLDIDAGDGGIYYDEP